MSVIFLKCDCKKLTRGGVKVEAPKHEQITVAVYKSLSPNWLVGSCIKCGKQKFVKESVAPQTNQGG